MKKIILPIFLIFFAHHLFAQSGSIIGQVTDKDTGESLPFCNVFINNTTIATTTDLDGNFLLSDVPEGDFELGFSFIGYQAIQKAVSVKSGVQLTINMALQSFEQELSDVEIKASRDRAWERDLRRFKNYFLGTDEFAAKCEILNPWVIDFPDDNSTNNFKAFAIQPIEIENHALGYKLTFDLKEFTRTPQFYLISGATRFIEMDNSDASVRQKWQQNRLDNYLRSPMNMFRAMIQGQHNQEGFYLYGDKPGGSETSNLRSDNFASELGKSVILYNPENLVSPGRKSGEYRIFLKGRIEVHYEKGFSNVNTYKDAPYPISWIEVKGNYVNVKSNGMILNPRDVTFSGDMDKNKVGSLLPMDYMPDLSTRLSAGMVKDANSLQERVYLHFDRDYYYRGDQVFFKAYMQYADPAFKREMSKVLYVDLVSVDLERLVQKRFKIENGQVIGDFYLPDTLSSKSYFVRAYTNWNRNYGPDAFFIKALPVLDFYSRISPLDLTKDQNSENIQLKFRPDKNVYGPRERVKLSALVTDENGVAVSANLSVSVTDMDLAKPLNLNPTILNGIQVEKIASTISADRFSYPIERELTLEGVFTNDKKKPEAMDFTVYFNDFNGNVDLRSEKDGSFKLDGLEFFGEMDFTFMALDKKGQSTGNFELTPKLSPPIYIPANLEIPKISKSDSSIFPFEEEDLLNTIELDQVIVEDSEEGSNKSFSVYGKPDYVIKGEEIMRGGSSIDLLQGLKPFIPGMTVNSLGEVTLRQGSGSVLNTNEPIVMINGAMMPGNGVANNINTINPNEVERIEVVTRVSSMMGDYGRNGIIAIYLKQGKGQDLGAELFRGAGLNRKIIEGFSPSGNFFVLDHESEEIPEGIDFRPTLFWSPYIFTDRSSGLFEIEFFMNDHVSDKLVTVQGVDAEGNPIMGTFVIKMSPQH